MRKFITLVALLIWSLCTYGQNNSNKMIARGTYTQSGQGWSVTYQKYLDPLPDAVYSIAFYENHISIGSFNYWYDASKSSEKYKAYSNDDFAGFHVYYVDANYNMYYVMTSGGHKVSYQMRKGEVTFPHVGSNTGGGYNNKNSSSGSYKGNSGSSGRSSKVYKHCSVCSSSGKCRTCNGKGTYWDSYNGNRKICPNCRNGKCSSCNGRGQWYE